MIPRRSFARLAGILCSAVCSHPSVCLGQGTPYSDALLPQIRAAASSIPGPRPRELRYIAVGEAHPRLNVFVAGADTQRITSVFPVFQIRFADRWLMVDAGLDSAAIVQYYGSMAGVAYSKARYDSVQLALKDAAAVVLTHEHFDHANGVQRGPYFREVAARTLLTSAQRQSWLSPPARAFFGMSPDSMSRFRTLDYDFVYALAPGVVLIKAPGHSPGSQFVYVKLADGREVLLIGDLVWMMPGLIMNRQKPQAASDDMKEDRTAIQHEMDWIRSIMSAGTIAVTCSHDKRQLDSLVAQGVLHVGLGLHRN